MTTITIKSTDKTGKTQINLSASTEDPKKAEEIGKLVALVLSQPPQQ